MIENKAKFYLPMIRDIAEKHCLPIRLLMAIVWQESAFNTMAARYEPKLIFQYMPKSYAEALSITMDTEICFQHCSWGLMQVLGVKARELSFYGYLYDLTQPAIGMEYGARVLDQLCKRYPVQDQVIAAYNAGSVIPSKTIDGHFINQVYVDNVKDKLKKVDNMIDAWNIEQIDR